MILQWLPGWLPLLITLIALIRRPSLVVADADYESVRIRFDYPYMGGRGGDPKDKYWRKSKRLVGISLADISGAFRRVDVS